jgi:hypothetical protein
VVGCGIISAEYSDAVTVVLANVQKNLHSNGLEGIWS